MRRLSGRFTRSSYPNEFIGVSLASLRSFFLSFFRLVSLVLASLRFGFAHFHSEEQNTLTSSERKMSEQRFYLSFESNINEKNTPIVRLAQFDT